jgi:hypothetical protein
MRATRSDHSGLQTTRGAAFAQVMDLLTPPLACRCIVTEPRRG